MRSLLFVPADSAKKLDKGMTSGADALIVDLEDSIAHDGKAKARESAAAFLKGAMAAPSRPYILVRVNGLQTGLIDADLDAVVPAKPDAIMLPKAEGGASVVHAPVSNMRFGSGLAHLRPMLDREVVLAVAERQ